MVQKLVKNAELFDQRISNSKTSRVKIMHCAKFVMHVTQLIVSYIYNMLLSNTFTFRSVTSQYFTPNCIKKLNKSSINSQSFDFLPLLTDFSILCEFARHHAAKPLQRKIYMSCDVISRESMGYASEKQIFPKYLHFSDSNSKTLKNWMQNVTCITWNGPAGMTLPELHGKCKILPVKEWLQLHNNHPLHRNPNHPE